MLTQYAANTISNMSTTSSLELSAVLYYQRGFYG
jgi:hypothetical protein